MSYISYSSIEDKTFIIKSMKFSLVERQPLKLKVKYEPVDSNHFNVFSV